ncbi:MAG TPA: hypothetical protein VFA06_01870 [Actinocrinis sp.]|uniref:hypothetical protein n=1 Tax=Actinocrinis sp. TaxID=1920516 RepID=UPI002D322F3D|nr:hypothetical protein [Actinocrinis sp.]HZU54594.1 hypothetical protein [Actinocrinis sp.]
MEHETDPDRQSDVSVVRRLGSTPQERGSTNEMNCPDVFELSDGSFGCIGTDLTETLRGPLPPGASIGSRERLVSIPRQTMRDALPDIIRVFAPQGPHGHNFRAHRLYF